MTWQDQFPDVSEIITEHITLYPETFCVDDLMDEMYHYTLRKLQIHDKPDVGVEILNHSDFEQCQIFADRLRLRQILVHLLNHSICNTETGYIYFGYQTTHSNRIKFSVEDTGEGIPEKQLPYIFRRYNHAELTREHLGLFVSRGLVRLMGGNLKIKTDGAGATFTFSIACNPCEIT